MPSGGRPCGHFSGVIAHFGVVTKDGGCIALSMAALYDLEVNEAKVLNA